MVVGRLSECVGSREAVQRQRASTLLYLSGHGDSGHVAHSTGPGVQLPDKCPVSHGLPSWIVSLGLESWVLDGVIVTSPRWTGVQH